MEILHTNTLPHQCDQMLALHSGTGDGQDHLVDTDSLLLLLYAAVATHQLCQSRGGEFPGQWGRWCGPSECRLLLLLVGPAVLVLLYTAPRRPGSPPMPFSPTGPGGPVTPLSTSAPGEPISPFSPSLPSLPSLPLSTSTCGQVLEPAGSHRRWCEMCLFLSDLHPEWRRG